MGLLATYVTMAVLAGLLLLGLVATLTGERDVARGSMLVAGGVLVIGATITGLFLAV